MTRVYLDHAATTPLSASARAALLACLDEVTGNPSSIHREGQRARAVVERARHDVARALGVEDDEIVFTASGTESDNLALRGACWAADVDGLPHLVTTAIEHDAVRRTARWLSRRGVDVEVIAPQADGAVRAQAVLAALRPGTTLVSVMAVNSETGVRQPVEELGAECRHRGVTFHVDAVQALGRIDVAPIVEAADLLSFSAHKVGGPRGCGVLVVRRGLKLQPALTGGEQESGLRPGTENVPAIAGAAVAIGEAVAERPRRAERLAALTRQLEAGLAALGGVRVHGAAAPRAPGFTNASFDGADGEALVQALDLSGFAASTGSACTSGSVAPSHVLSAMGASREEARAAVRFSLGPGNGEEELRRLLGVLPGLLESVRGTAAAAPAGTHHDRRTSSGTTGNPG